MVYGGAGLFPEHGVYLFALDAKSGSRLWQRTIGQPAQGYMATDGKVLWVSGGRAGAIGVRLRDGREVGSADAYGTYLVAAGGHFFCEDSQRQRQLQLLPGLTHPAHFITLSGEIAVSSRSAGDGRRDACGLISNGAPSWSNFGNAKRCSWRSCRSSATARPTAQAPS